MSVEIKNGLVIATLFIKTRSTQGLLKKENISTGKD